MFFTGVWRVTDNQQKEYLHKLEAKLNEEKTWKKLLEELSEGIVCFDD